MTKNVNYVFSTTLALTILKLTIKFTWSASKVKVTLVKDIHWLLALSKSLDYHTTCSLMYTLVIFSRTWALWGIYVLGLCQFRFQKNRNSDSLTVFGLLSGIDSRIVGQKNHKMNRKGIIFLIHNSSFQRIVKGIVIHDS